MADWDFIGFTYNGKHSIRDLGIYRVSNSNRYDDNITATMTDLTADVPGGDGQYYFGTTFKNRTFQINFAFDNLYEEDITKIKKTFQGDGIHDLVFDETPYKAWSAKVTGTATLKHLCFEENGRRVYRGEGNVTFTCYYPYAHTPERLWKVTNKGKTGEQWTYEIKDGKNKNNYISTPPERNAYPNKEEWLVDGILADSDALNEESSDYAKRKTIYGDRPVPFVMYLNVTDGTLSNARWRISQIDEQGANTYLELNYTRQQLISGEQLIFNSKTRILSKKKSDGTEEIVPYTYSGNIFTLKPGYSYYLAITGSGDDAAYNFTTKYNFEYL